MPPQPLRRQIVLTVVILTVVVYAAIAYGAKLTYDQHLLQLGAETRTMAATVAVYVNRNLETADAVAVTASRHPSLRALDPSAAEEVLSPLVTPDGLLHNALMAGADGEPIAWARPPDANVEALVDHAWLKTVIEKRSMQISPMLGQSGSAVHAIVLGYPIVSTDGVVGVLGLVVHLEALERVLASIPLPAGSVVTLTDPAGIVVARSLDAAQYVGRSAAPGGRARSFSEVPASTVLTGVDGVERVFGNAIVERGQWLASVGIPSSVALDRTWPIYRRNFLISILASAVILAITFWFGRRWLQSFGHLDATARRISSGDLSPLQSKPMPSAEMEQLQQTLADMITSLQRARESIASQFEDERRMREELQSLQQQVIRQERLAAIGVLVSGVAHELNNPLQAILGFAELLQLQPDMPDQARADLTLIRKESARASAIIRNLQRFGRQMSEPSPVRLRDVINSVLELRHRKLQEVNILVLVEDHSQGVVMAIFTELQQVMLNFAINAEQAIVQAQPAIRQITIRTGDRDGWAWLEVEDTGHGVPAEDEAKLFQPFYTTKAVGEGTGLGLSVSYDIIRSHNGRIGYRRAASGGALFFFELPLVSDEKASS